MIKKTGHHFHFQHGGFPVSCANLTQVLDMGNDTVPCHATYGVSDTHPALSLELAHSAKQHYSHGAMGIRLHCQEQTEGSVYVVGMRIYH